MLVTSYLYERHRDSFDLIVEKMKSRVPGITNVDAFKLGDGTIALRFNDGAFKDPFYAKYISDGTIKMFSYLVLLNQPHKHPLLCIEEPENFLHPYLMTELTEELREYGSNNGQLFVSTHSPVIANSVRPDELFVIKKKDGVSTITNAVDLPFIKDLIEEGDKLGSLWLERLLD